MDEFILIRFDDLRQLVVHRIVAVGTEHLDYALPSGNRLRLCLRREFKRTQFVVFSLGKEHQCFHIVRKEAQVLCILLTAGHLRNDPHEAKDTVSVGRTREVLLIAKEHPAQELEHIQ